MEAKERLIKGLLENMGSIADVHAKAGKGVNQSTGPSVESLLADLGGSEAANGYAQQLWRYLDDLAEKDPEEYKKFLDQQMRAAMPELAKKKDAELQAEQNHGAVAHQKLVKEQQSSVPSVVEQLASLSVTPPSRGQVKPLIQELDSSIDYRMKHLHDKGGAVIGVEVTLHLPHIMSASAVDLEVVGQELKVSEGPKCLLNLPVQFRVDEEGVRAKFNKSKQMLTVRIPRR
eukprot:jgi/Chlat1/2016/Chrsp158S08704